MKLCTYIKKQNPHNRNELLFTGGINFMPGLQFFDNILSFYGAQTLSAVFATGSIILATIIALLSLVITIANFSKRSSFFKILTIIFTVITTCMDFIIILYSNDGRYIKQSWQNEENYTYFGTMNNDKPHGWGKLFDKEENIYYVGEFSNGMPNGNGKFYKKTGGIDDKGQNVMFVWKEGEFLQGKGEGHVVLREFINGKPVDIFDGEMANDKKCGHGISHNYLDDNSYKIYKGSWAYDQKCGYGIETKYDESGNICERYTGTFWSDKHFGNHIYEYISDSNSKIIRVGWISFDNENKEDIKHSDYVYYFFDDKSLLSYRKGDTETKNADLNKEQRQEIIEKWPMPKKTIWD